ncbi:putative polytopic membrane protein [Botrytis fragariae]|uniref:Putative polytopic membrane protein n=1 Tax=Botrytis fragariae TaxID=1964551 RepID=A0A8H6B0H2_9HELO|nr:putative polytopic membrane protein [Botrytis fragariae]KAF5876850.1 putative polytopic membrane protein [Botrytis fragariae]
MAESNAWQLYVAVCVCYPSAFIGVSLRTYVRYFMQRVMGWDDWLMILSLAVYTMYTSFVSVGLYYGTGRHQEDLDESDFLWAIRYWYFSEWAYVVTMTIIKTAIALFYLRIMVIPWHRVAVKVIMWIVIVFGFAYFWCVVIQCWPIPFIWERYATTPGRSTGNCLPRGIVLGGTYLHSIISAGSDWALALLPIVMLWNVQMPTGIRLIVGGIVGCGAIASTATIIRIPTVSSILNADDFLFKSIPLAVWSTVEPGMAIFAASLATLRPLLRRIFPNHFRNAGIPSLPSLRIPTSPARKKQPSDDVEMGINTTCYSEPRPEQTAGESLETIQIHLDDRIEVDRSTSKSMTFHEESSGLNLRSKGSDDEMMELSHTSRGASLRLAPLVFSPTCLTHTIPSPSTLSPSHVASCMRDSQYNRDSKVVIPSSPI